jgi:hypothetical protein
MRKLLTILLLALLPLQFSWAAVAGYCEHEVGVASEHVGHHEHRHADAERQDNDSKNVTTTGVMHPDCATCHGGGVAATGSFLQALTISLLTLTSSEDSQQPAKPLLSRPERPKWVALAF